MKSGRIFDIWGIWEKRPDTPDTLAKNLAHLLLAVEKIPAPILAISDAFETSYTFSASSELKMMKEYADERDYIFPVMPVCWMVDLTPRLAHAAIVPPGIVTEYRPDGRLFLAAAEEDFNGDNPAHIAAAWTPYSVLHPLNTIPRS